MRWDSSRTRVCQRIWSLRRENISGAITAS